MKKIAIVPGVFALMCGWALQAAAQPHHATPPSHHDDQLNALVKVVRESTDRYRDASNAMADGYLPQLGCVTGSSEGVMGVHFINGPLVGDAELDPTRPEALVYEPKPDGRMRLVAVEFVVIAEVWNAANPAPPQLMGQLFHLTDSPNRFGLPAFYSLHVWAWRDNPQGTFANWNPKVSCDGFNPEPVN